MSDDGHDATHTSDGDERSAPTAAVVEDERHLPAAKVVHHFTPAERAARGKAARAEVPRSSHAGWEPPSLRHDPVALLEEQARTRVPELLPIRYGRMLVSPFTFYRGAAYVMASDLAGHPRTGLTVQLCGDAHLSNFGVFLAPDRRLVFSLNDFDETLPGPFEWDVKRLVASFAVAGRDNGFTAKQRERVNRAVVRAYREAMASFAEMRTLDVWHARLDVDTMLEQARKVASAKVVERFESNVARARAKDSLRAFSKLVEVVDGRPRIKGDPPLIVPIEDLAAGVERQQLEDTLRDILRSYRRTLSGDRRRLMERFQYAHMARKVVGVGSVGTRAFIVLMLGRDGDDPLFLQVKQAETSVLEPFLGRSSFASHGQRVVEGQRLMQSASDILLGWIRVTGLDAVQRDFYVRQLWDGKGSAVIETMDPERLAYYARACGWTLARAHARSGDAIAIASYLGSSDTFDRALAAFAEDYADQTEADWAAVAAAVESGRLEATPGL
ncbi:MAG: DUF2252 domain-containing protein [Gaiella sp.]